MKLSDVFPKKYLQGQDLQGKAYKLTIAGVTLEEMRPSPKARPEKKPVLHFKETDKGLIFGRQVGYDIAQIVGSEDCDDWTGHKITVFPVPMTVAGKARVAVRVRKTNGETSLPSSMKDDDDF